MARPEFAASDRMRKKVRSLAIQGVPQEVIAGVIECDPKTLRKHFRQELDRGMAEANAKVVGALYRSATRGRSVAAQIFWVKTRMRWREPEAPPDAGPGTEGQPVHVVILPDNGRDRPDPDEDEDCKSTREKFDTKDDSWDANMQTKELQGKGLHAFRAQLLATSAYSSIYRSISLNKSTNRDAHLQMLSAINCVFPRSTSNPHRLTR